MKKYLEVYQHYKELIEQGQLKSGDRLPSVRKSAELLSVSKTTVQNAYFDLQADGYIIALPKSGYFVTDINVNNVKVTTSNVNEKKQIKFDLKSGDADRQSFDLTLWQRYIKSALRQKDRLMSYSEVQGESDLRIALSDYIKNKRNVIASPDRIVVGAGVNALLGVLCSLIKEQQPKAATVSFPDKSFLQGRKLFYDYGFQVHSRDKEADIIYVSPSHMTSYGDVMPVSRRVELVHYSESKGSLVIEDDFDSDFVYSSRPTPSLYTLSTKGNVVYMGSFSNVLLPSIRISYMVLTESLAASFQKNKENFAQTAGKTEQIALCQYLRDGHMRSQTRKIRRIYTAKTKQLYEAVCEALPSTDCEIAENGLMLKLTVKNQPVLPDFSSKGISVNIKEYSNNVLKLILISSALDADKIEAAVATLKACLKNK